MIAIRGVPIRSVPRLFRIRRNVPPSHVFICIADHFEPKWRGADVSLQRARVTHWVRDYPASVAGIFDSTGRPPQHTFFYPAEEYETEYLDQLAILCGRGYGAVEIHLHHHQDTSDGLRDKLICFRDKLVGHGLLQKESDGRVTYGFIHGNWALDNSHPKGHHCGVNDEITILRETGCYADFTMPSAPAYCQTRTVNSIYYAVDDPGRPKSHDSGSPARVGLQPPRDALLIVQGPLLADWSRRKFGVMPGLENGDLQGAHVPTLRRWELWLRAGVSIVGRPEWVFVKLHTHGTQECNASMLLGPAMREFHTALGQWGADNPSSRYYYVTAREMARLVHQAEAGLVEPRLNGSSER